MYIYLKWWQDPDGFGNYYYYYNYYLQRYWHGWTFHLACVGW